MSNKKLFTEKKLENKYSEVKSGLVSLFSGFLADNQIVSNYDQISSYEKTTFKTPNKVSLILKPIFPEEVSKILKICSKYKFAVYPISKGKNFGYGSRIPTNELAILIDLSRMDNILDYSENFGFVRVQPGVTFQNLYDFLEANQSNLMLNVIGGSPEASVIGNILERGDGVGRYSDRSKYICNMEVVLPSGKTIQTGHGSFKDAKSADIFDHGVGPSFDQLFIQSNFGVVTALTIFLQPKPNYSQHIHFSLKNQNQLPKLVDSIRKLKMEGIIDGNCGIWNDFRSLSTIVQYNAKEGNLKREKLQATFELEELNRWNGMFGIQSQNEEIGTAIRRYVIKKIENLVSRLFITCENHRLNQSNDLIIKGTQDDIAIFGKLKAANRIMSGVPSYQSIKSCYWRKSVRPKIDLNPDRDNCGVIWSSFAVPAEGESVYIANEISEQIINEFGFEPHITLLFPQERTAYFLVMLLYDRDSSGHDEEAMKCHDKLSSTLMKNGYYPYRLGVQSMHIIQNVNSSYIEFLKTIKTAIDPRDIISPGRYDFRHLL